MSEGKIKGSTIAIIFVLGLSLYIGFFWESLDSVRALVHAILNPTFGALLAWNSFFGFLIVVAIISLVLIFAQKLFTDQDQLRELKKQQKDAQEEMKQHKDNPEKLMELQKKSLATAPQMMKLTFRSIVYTGIPIVLFFRWFQEILSPIYGGWWLLYYFIATIIFSTIFRKIFKVV